nr:hypothetical protein CTI12_AA405830 [Tanacetum cinerariifolium]
MPGSWYGPLVNKSPLDNTMSWSFPRSHNCLLILVPFMCREARVVQSSSVVSYGSDPPLSAFVYSSSSLIPTSSMEEENGDQEVHKAENHNHSCVAGGGVIIGGLATAFFATLYCYIKVTRKKDGDEKH